MTENINKRYWGIGEVCEIFNEPQSRIRFWCDFFGIALKGEKHFRKFTQSDLDKLSKVKAYIIEGYHLKAIKNKL